jgi:HK97 family phage major capsid protein
MTERPGLLTKRYLQALTVADGAGGRAAAAYCKAQNGSRWQELADLFATKAAVPAMDATAHPALSDPVSQDFAALVAQFSVVAALMPSFRRVPLNVNCISQTAGATAYWSDFYQSSGAAIPLSASSLTNSSLQPLRLSALSVITKDLLRASTLETDTLVANDLGRAAAAKLDWGFLDPTTSGSPAEAPASISASGRMFAAAAGTVDGIDADLEKLLAALSDNGSSLENVVFVMNTMSAARLSRMRGSSGAPAYPGMTAKGGTLLGFRCLATSHIPRVGSPSPGASYVFAVDPSRVWVGTGGVEISTSDAAIVEMDNAPSSDSSSGTGANAVSLWQTESLAVKSVQYINWKPVAGQSHVATLTGVEW